MTNTYILMFATVIKTGYHSIKYNVNNYFKMENPIAGKSDFKALKSQNGRLRKQLEEAEKRIKELENSIQEHETVNRSEKKKIKIGNWNIVKSGGYYRAYQRIKGKVHGVYVGKRLNGAKLKIDAWETKFFVKQS